MSPELPASTRIWFAWVCFFRVLFGGAFARLVWDMAHGSPASLPEASTRDALPAAPVELEGNRKASREDAALAVLALLQREGRLVDFLEQDIAAFADGDVGAAARVVHEGCRRALRAHATLAPLRVEAEGARVTVGAGFSVDEVNLTGNVQGSPPYTGVLRHRGWRVSDVHLPVSVRDHDASVVAPAEIEL